MNDNQNSYYQNKKSINQNYWKLSTRTELETHFELFYSQRFNFPSALVPILIDNKVSKDNFELFLYPKIKNLLPDPSIFIDMDKTVKRIANEIETKNPIGVFGDYDVDGATSAALLKLFLQCFGIEVHIHIPDRFLEGYGPNISALNSLVSKGSNLIITVDCGINSHEPLKELNKTDIDCIIIDHHTPDDDLPPAFSIVNPKRKENGIEYHYLSAVGVTFIMIVGLTRELRQRGVFEKIKEPNLFRFLDLVALGTVCDVVPLKGLNRCFVKAGLNIISQRKNLGINALCDISDLNKIPDEETLGYKLGPKINAAGRIGSSDMGVSLLISKDISKANELASKLYQLNEKRKKLTNNSTLEAIGMVESEKNKIGKLPDFLFLVSENWNEGIIGILAGKIKEKYNRPCCVISIGQNYSKGSARSIANIPIGEYFLEALDKKLLVKGGGHDLAAGLAIENNKIQMFKDFLISKVKHAFQENELVSEISVTSQLSISALNSDLMDWIKKLGPWGQGNPTPKFIIKNVIIKKLVFFGKEKKHLLVKVSDNSGEIDCKIFNINETAFSSVLEKNKSLHLLGNLVSNEWNNKNKVEFNLIDIMT
ncbi:MAG: single-stranded-DNA-specific exonuclease RecJ [Alphaproteobacteria bacterium]|nr:MAG: single-stranded-DNA-specific exonuclease RecJ [Alphaproteobacteria bacterium]